MVSALDQARAALVTLLRTLAAVCRTLAQCSGRCLRNCRIAVLKDRGILRLFERGSPRPRHAAASWTDGNQIQGVGPHLRFDKSGFCFVRSLLPQGKVFRASRRYPTILQVLGLNLQL
mgnify:CR=1 FL=1